MLRVNAGSVLCVPWASAFRAIALGAIVSGAAAPAWAQIGGPLAGPAVPSYNPGVPSYNPGVPRQAPGFSGSGQGPGFGQARRPPSRQNFIRQPRIAPQAVVPYGYGYSTGPIIIVPQTVIIPPQRRRTTMDNPFFGDLGDPFF